MNKKTPPASHIYSPLTSTNHQHSSGTKKHPPTTHHPSLPPSLTHKPNTQGGIIAYCLIVTLKQLHSIIHSLQAELPIELLFRLVHRFHADQLFHN